MWKLLSWSVAVIGALICLHVATPIQAFDLLDVPGARLFFATSSTSSCDACSAEPPKYRPGAKLCRPDGVCKVSRCVPDARQCRPDEVCRLPLCRPEAWFCAPDCVAPFWLPCSCESCQPVNLITAEQSEPRAAQ